MPAVRDEAHDRGEARELRASGTATRDFTAEVAENAENGRSMGEGRHDGFVSLGDTSGCLCVLRVLRVLCGEEVAL